MYLYSSLIHSFISLIHKNVLNAISVPSTLLVSGATQSTGACSPTLRRCRQGNGLDWDDKQHSEEGGLEKVSRGSGFELNLNPTEY